MRPLLISCLALAVAAGCAKKTETKEEAGPSSASLDAVEVTGSRLADANAAAAGAASSERDRALQRQESRKVRVAAEPMAMAPPPAPVAHFAQPRAPMMPAPAESTPKTTPSSKTTA
ncbi:hypothetical protein [Arenimonas daejeonensis]|uniref:hypothetical protein n=1 Tax=Arenimonas daejeonensis TaxID=370777 RepID=UPI001D13C0A9|nr:hypothetical protein [Arenimonas daejeonensis]